MKATILSRIFAVGIFMLIAWPAMAQGKIDKLVSQLEKKSDVTVTYTENRNPKNKKIVKQSTILSGDNKKDAESLWQAFEAERENSVKVVKTRNESFIISFKDKNYQSSYILNVNGGKWTLVVSKKSPGFDDNDGISFMIPDFDCPNFGELNLDALQGLEALSRLEGLESLRSLEGLGGRLNDLNLSGDVRVYDKDGNLIYQSPDSDKKNSSCSPRRKRTRSVSTSTSRSGSGQSRTTTTTRVANGSNDNVYTYTYIN